MVESATGAPDRVVEGSIPSSPTIRLNEEAVERFFRFARERQAVYIRRRAGLPAPWTKDEILRQYRFTNVYREQDKTTAWFRKYVRGPMRDRPEVLLATVLFRWFNTIRSGETIFQQPDMLNGGLTPWQHYLDRGDTRYLADPLRRQGPPWVTGAYMIRSPQGMDKLDGIVHSIHQFRTTSRWESLVETILEQRDHYPTDLKAVWSWLKGFYGLGPFLAYEIVTDLRHTALLDRAPDIMIWANPGPGALRGAQLLLSGPERVRKGRLKKSTYPEAHAVMEELLKLSQDSRWWPQESLVDGYHNIEVNTKYRLQLAESLKYCKIGDWRAWEMREPEMWLCEMAKYERTRLGFGRPRGTFSRG